MPYEVGGGGTKKDHRGSDIEVNFERQSMQDRQEYKGHFSF